MPAVRWHRQDGAGSSRRWRVRWAGAGRGPLGYNRSPFPRGYRATAAPGTDQWLKEGTWRQVGEKQLKG